MKLGDRGLARRLRAGDRGAARELVAQHNRAIYGFLIRLGATPSVAEDLTQDAYAKAWCNLGRLRDATSLKAWLIAIARNEYRQWARRHAMETQRLDRHAPRPAATPAVDDLVVQDESERALLAAMDRLEHDLRELVALHYMQGLSIREVASILDVPTGTIKSRLNRALRRLRTELEEHHDFDTAAQTSPA